MLTERDNLKFSCIILAGGEGKRFGHKDKGLITLHNKTLIEHVIERIKPQVDDIIISANRNTEQYTKHSNTVVADTASHFQGPLTGIASCLPHCKHDWILITPCDTPSLPENLVSKLYENNEKKVIVAESGGHRQLVFFNAYFITRKFIPIYTRWAQQSDVLDRNAKPKYCCI